MNVFFYKRKSDFCLNRAHRAFKWPKYA